MAHEKTLEELFTKGVYKPIDNEFLVSCVDVLSPLGALQNKYKKDMDSLVNEIHDSLVARYLGFELVNTLKHGFDCKMSQNKNVFLESKVADINAKTWNATFNDTTITKANSFKSKNVWLALSIWSNISKVICICYGQNPLIGDFLIQKVKDFKENGKTVRSTQSISFSTLIFKYNFKLLSISMSKEELLAFLILKNKNYKKINLNSIVSLSDFEGLTPS